MMLLVIRQGDDNFTALVEDIKSRNTTAVARTLGFWPFVFFSWYRLSDF